MKLLLILVLSLGLLACNSEGANTPDLIVGTWLVKDSGAPFPYHMYVFNADGTMQQANPDAGDPRTSDSDGKGVWKRDGERVRVKWMEIVADRGTHLYAGRLEVSSDLIVTADTFNGTESVRFFDATGAQTDGPTKPTALEGNRVVLP
jgi:hypothetical protein